MRVIIVGKRQYRAKWHYGRIFIQTLSPALFIVNHLSGILLYYLPGGIPRVLG